MKTLGILCLALAVAGCSTHRSHYANDPRARCVGPAYLDYIDQHPADRSTQYFYPVFYLQGATVQAELSGAPVNPQIQRFLTVRPAPSHEAEAGTGEGWPKLESQGIPFSCGE